ncbi:MAG: hypothetical protein ACREKN_03315 [Longimicrobiaceae bacterium]
MISSKVSGPAALAAALCAALPVTGQLPPDTLSPAFDSPATRRLVEFAIAESGRVPPTLVDYQADVRSVIQLSLAGDSTLGGELQISADEMASEVRWRATGHLHQRVVAHRSRVLVPTVYTLGSLYDNPWVVPHMYGATLGLVDPTRERGVLVLGSAVHPFSARGVSLYRYSSGDTVGVRVQGETVRVVPVQVRPRVTPREAGVPLTVGTFYLDVDRGAVARARYGVVEQGGGIGIQGVGNFYQLENSLWNGQFWLPYRQRIEIQVFSRLLGGVLAARSVNDFSNLRLNTGWVPPSDDRLLLVRAEGVERVEMDGEVAAGAARFAASDFDDLRRAALAARSGGSLEGTKLSLHYARTSHLFRHDRVEGPYLGLGARLRPADPVDDSWQLYGTAGWAFSEGVARGELSGRYRLAEASELLGGGQVEFTGAAYRRLLDSRVFLPTHDWDWIYSLTSLFAGVDTRDYYDAQGAEAFLTYGRGRWSGRVGGRWERQQPVKRNTDRYLFGSADADGFPPLAPTLPGDHAALEGAVRYALGSGAFGISRSLLASLRGEWGVGDFDYGRLLGLASTRIPLGLFGFAARVDGAHLFGDPPPQRVVRFGGREGLRGFEDELFGGSSALLARGRFLIGLPPRGQEPVPLGGGFALPPLRPHLVLLAEAGWSKVSEQAEVALALTGSLVTDGWEGSYGAGVSFFDDALTVEYLAPVGELGEGRWYFGLVNWF